MALELKDKLEIFKNAGFKYNTDSGDIIGIKGKPLKRRNILGYIDISYRYHNSEIRIYGHQLAWYLYYNEVPDVIDHINRITSDNRIENLRNGTQNDNCKNVNHRGLHFDKKLNKYRVRIVHNKKKVYDKLFVGFEEAEINYLKIKKQLGHIC